MTDQTLDLYLNNHWSGATAGLAMFRRVSRGHGVSEVAQRLADLVVEIEQDRETLRGVMRSVEVRPRRSHEYAGRLLEVAGRLKPNGRLLRRSPLTDVLEIEALRDAVRGKVAGWEALLVVSAREPRLDRELLNGLIARAGEQIDILDELHEKVCAVRLVG